MGHINTVPGQAQYFPFPHAGMNGREDNGLEPGLTGLEQSLCFCFPGEIPQPSIWFLIFLNGGQFFLCGLA